MINRLAVLATVGMLSLSGLAITASPAGAVSKSQQKALKSFASQIHRDLAQCEAAAADTQVELGLAIKAGNSVTQSELDDVDSASQSAQTACDQTKNNGVLSVGTLGVPGPISYIHSLGNVPIEANIWATDDTTAVLHDIQRFVETNASNTTALSTQLNNDVATADSDAASIRAAMNGAAKRLRLKNYGGLGLIQWAS